MSYEEAQLRWGAELERRLHESVSATGLVREMLSYQISCRGKRIRLLLPVWGAANLGGCPEDALDIGVGLELLHNATLAFDDLQDGDLYRRGAPTLWHRWGSAQAINAGKIGARAHPRDALPNTTRPTRNNRRRPRLSASRPVGISSAQSTIR